jgi:hypothetical protein
MNPEIKEKWINALRSEEYQQTQDNLKTDEGYCCLGVLCDIYAKENNVDWEKDFDEYTMFGYVRKLPHHVVKWAGLNSQSPEVKDDNGNYVFLINLNDTGSTFREIAGLIEKNPFNNICSIWKLK